MTTFHISEYKVSIKELENFNVFSDYYNKYDAVFEIVKPKEDHINKTLLLSVERYGTIKTVLFFVPMHTIADKCAAPAGDKLLLLLDWLMCIFDLSDLKITKQKKVGIMIGTMEAVYPYKEDYIIYYEMDIFRVDRDLNIKWIFNGSDIFHRAGDDSDTFKMKEDRICVYDWNEYYYEIDYDGNVLYDSWAEKHNKKV